MRVLVSDARPGEALEKLPALVRALVDEDGGGPVDEQTVAAVVEALRGGGGNAPETDGHVCDGHDHADSTDCEPLEKGGARAARGVDPQTLRQRWARDACRHAQALVDGRIHRLVNELAAMSHAPSEPKEKPDA